MTVRFDAGGEPVTGYRLISRLGSGGFGEVWKCEAPGGLMKAMKVIHGDLRNKDCDTYRFAEQELKSLHRVKQVRHPYLLALDRIDVVEGRLLIVMELADCNLWDRFRQCRKAGLPGIPRDELLRYMTETAEVLDLFDDQFNLQHLDIKPQNLFLLYNHVKVADFGQVKDLQGVMVNVTGGITPVYAAPETFDGFVSRYCDQYSLACVYQELLTGQRPFDGGSFQQLLMQHLQAPPNLQPAPAADRPALQKALAKKPEDRFLSVGAMVRALRDGTPVPPPPATPPPAALLPGASFDPPASFPDLALSESKTIALLKRLAPAAAAVAVLDPPTPRPVAEPVELVTTAPPAVAGPGVLRPTLVIGLGFTGMRVLQRLRKQVGDRFGPPDRLPCLRTLLIDTDPDALAAAVQPAGDGLAPLADEMVLDVRLNRATHYLDPRRGGRSLCDEWMDPALLYRLPRVPVTLGLRCLGRLAFLDHQKAVAAKLQAELEAALDPQAMADAAADTGLEVRTNRPKVVVVAGLAGGTGSGMLFDLAYLVRAKLRKLGYHDPDLTAVLHLPAEDAVSTPAAQANVYAALTELNHFTRADTTFTHWPDDRACDPAPPFAAVYLAAGLPHPPAAVGSGSMGTTPFTGGRRSGSLTVPMGSGVRRDPRRSGVLAPPPAGPANGPDPAEVTATWLRLHLLTPVGRTADDFRPPVPAGGVTVRAAGLTRWGWPRAEVVARVARVMAPVLVHHWVTPDPAREGSLAAGWVTGLWTRLGLDPDKLAARFRAEADEAAGTPLADQVAAATEAAAPRGWLARTPDPNVVAAAAGRLTHLLGRPQAQPGKQPVPVEESLAAAADAAAADALGELSHALPGLVENPQFRLAGAEEACRRLLFLLDQVTAHAQKLAGQAQQAAITSLDQLALVGSVHKNLKKQTAAEVTAALTGYPAAQLDYLLHLAALRVYHALTDQLKMQAQEVGRFRQRLEAHQPFLALEADELAGGPAPGDCLPAGCTTVEDAAQTFLKSLTDDDLTALDARVQAGLERTFGGLYQACLNSADGPDRTLAVLRAETRLYLNDRLGEADLAGMVRRRFGTDAGLADGLHRGHAAAAAELAAGPWVGQEVCVFAAPPGAAGEPLRRIAAGVLPASQAVAETPDEAAVVREMVGVPLTAVPHLGPAWRAAAAAAECSPYSRADVAQWADVDAD